MILYVESTYSCLECLSAFAAMWEKRVQFSVRPLELAREALLQSFKHRSVTMTLPMLDMGHLTITQSTAIAEYLDESREGPPIYPQDPALRARARQIQAWLRTDLGALRQERPARSVFAHTSVTMLSQLAEQQAQRLFSAAHRWLGEEAYLCGDWSIADIDMAAMLARLIRNGDPVPARLVRYAERIWERRAMSAWLDAAR